jgi:tetratricopeptide (TPR) repeat protein
MQRTDITTNHPNNPNNPVNMAKLFNIYFETAYAHDLKRERSQAIANYSQALRIRPSYTSYYNCGVIYCELGQFDEAVRAFSQALRIKPDDPDASLYREQACCRLEEESLAEITEKKFNINTNDISKINANDLFEIKANDLLKDKKINSGGSATVYEGWWQDKKVAIKEVDCKQSWAGSSFQSEKEIMSTIAQLPESNGHIVKLYGFIDNKITKTLVVEYISGGDLSDFIRKHKNPYLLTLHEIARDIACGLKYLHNYEIIHCDIKPANIMLESMRAKIGDFGFSRTKSNNKSDQLDGTSGYIAPELVQDIAEYTAATDMYAYAILLFRLYSGQNTYPITLLNDRYRLLGKVARGLRPPIPNTIPKDVVKLMTSAWRDNPIFRPTARAAEKELERIIEVQKKNNSFASRFSRHF